MPFVPHPNVFGARQRAHDPRERAYALAPAAVDMSKRYSLAEAFDIDVLDQGTIGSCTANALAVALYVCQKLLGITDPVIICRLWAYAEARIKEGTFPADAGAMIADVCDLALRGIAPETMKPYVPDAAWRPTPEIEAFAAAGTIDLLGAHQPIYGAGGLSAGITQALAEGKPVQIGMDWLAGFDDPNSTGGILQPAGQSRGGHSIAILLYLPPAAGREALYGFPNSWAPAWTRRDVVQAIDPAARPGWAFIPRSVVDRVVWEARAITPEAVTPQPQPQPSVTRVLQAWSFQGDVGTVAGDITVPAGATSVAVGLKDRFPDGNEAMASKWYWVEPSTTKRPRRTTPSR